MSRLPDKVNPGDETWVMLAPWGSHPRWDDEKEEWVDQLLDEEAGSRLVAAFRDEVLVDADHSSVNGGSTEALAWIVELDDRPDGLWALFRWTDTGAEAVSGRRWRFVSPAWTVDAAGRPDRLVSCALTNRPNIPSKPILNSAAGGSGEPTRKPQMEELKKALGLAPDAADADVLAAVQALQAENASLKEAQLNSEAEAFAEEQKDKVQDKAVLANAYKKDPELAKKLVLNMKAPAKAPETPRKPVCNSADALRPDLNRDRPLSDQLRGLSPEEANKRLLSL